jgi:type II secretory ATPase GspE/PulE/Tfp pilus assembly ATPase PilB-like protein
MEDKSSLKAVRLKDFEPISREILKLIPRSLAQQKLVIPIAKKNGRITAAVPKGDGMVIPQGLHTVTKCPVDLVLAPLEDIIDFIKKYYPEDSRDMSDVNSVTPQGAGVLTPALPEVLEKLICDGAVNRASEILVENSHNKLRIRFRIRGVLVTHMQDQIPVDQVTFMSEFIQKMGAQKKEAGVRWADWSVTGF